MLNNNIIGTKITMANLKLPNLSGPSSFIWLAKCQRNLSVRLQRDVLDIQDIRD